MMENTISRSTLLDQYRRSYQDICQTLEDMPRYMWTWKPAPEKWSIHENLVHLADSEANSYLRCRTALAESGNHIMAYDQDIWAKKLDYHQQSPDMALELFGRLRGMTYQLIRDLPDAAWSQTFEHPENGTVTLDRWLNIYAHHTHIGQMKRTYDAWLQSLEIDIVEYRPEHQPAFEKFNRDWISHYFWMEPIDEQVLGDPETHIIQPGGAIIMALYQGKPVGTVALRSRPDGIFEMTKMAVDSAYHGKRIGWLLGRAVLEKAASMYTGRVMLYSHTNLTAAINLYYKLGFHPTPIDTAAYKRSDIQMVYDPAVASLLKGISDKLKAEVWQWQPALARLSWEEWHHKPSQKSWSKLEMLGHLIDSAANNHQRFVRAQEGNELRFPKYDPDGWVERQNYRHAAPGDLLRTWEAYNLRLADVIRNIHPDYIQTPCYIGDSEPVTLQFIAEDYISHLIHHLQEITAL